MLAALAFFNGMNRRGRPIANLHCRHGGCQGVAIGVRKQKDRLFGMIDHSIRQAGLIVDDERNQIAAGNVFGGDNGELVPGDALAELDRFNRAAGNGTAHRGAKNHARQREIVDIASLAG